MIEFTNVTKKYPNGVVGLRHVNLKIERGEFVFIIGQSGAGKSSILKLITRQENVTTEEIVIDKTNITKLSRFSIHKLRRKVGVIYQDFKLLPKLTVYQNVAFALEAIGLTSREVRKRAMYAISIVGLGEKILSYPNQLSGGQQQRVSIARAIANNPDIIIADEPTGNLDPDNSRQIMAILKKLNKEGKTIIMATHNYDLIAESNCRVIKVDQGNIERDEVNGHHDV